MYLKYGKCIKRGARHTFKYFLKSIKSLLDIGSFSINSIRDQVYLHGNVNEIKTFNHKNKRLISKDAKDAHKIKIMLAILLVLLHILSSYSSNPKSASHLELASRSIENRDNGTGYVGL